MNKTIKNIIILAIVAAALVFLYVAFFSKGNGASGSADLVSSSANSPLNVNSSMSSVSFPQTSSVGNNFLSLLLSIRSISLNDAIFSQKAWPTLHDSSVTLSAQNGDQGRPNPFAPLGVDILPLNNNASSPTDPGITAGTSADASGTQALPFAASGNTSSGTFAGDLSGAGLAMPSSSPDAGINPPPGSN